MADVVQLNARLAAALKARAELEAQLTLPEVLADHTALARIGRELSRTAPLAEAGEALTVSVRVTDAQKCERCWHYTLDVGADPSFPGACKRCAGNLSGQHETRHAA